jgi:thymidylate kinase
MRISLNGLDGSGKTTLANAVVEEFERRGHRAVRHRGLLAERHPARRLLKKLPLVRQPDSGFITTAYLLAGYALDALLVKHDPPRPADAVIVQDGYADRTVAFGMAGGPYLAAVLALRWPRVFAPFDLAVYLHAPLDVRRERLATREKLDAVDIRGIEDPDFADTFTAMLVHGMGRRHRNLLVFDTSRHTPQEMASQIVQAALGTTPPPPQDALVPSEWGRAA